MKQINSKIITKIIHHEIHGYLLRIINSNTCNYKQILIWADLNINIGENIIENINRQLKLNYEPNTI